MPANKSTIVDLSAGTTCADTRRVATGSDRPFGNFIRSLRRARGLTQESLAERSHFSTDTVGRLEAGRFSPSLQTLRKLTTGLGLRLSTFFAAFELHDLQNDAAIADLLSTRTPAEQRRALRMLVMFFESIDERADELPEDLSPDDDEPDEEGEPEGESK